MWQLNATIIWKSGRAEADFGGGISINNLLFQIMKIKEGKCIYSKCKKKYSSFIGQIEQIGGVYLSFGPKTLTEKCENCYIKTLWQMCVNHEHLMKLW